MTDLVDYTDGDDNERPDSSAVFVMTNGEKIRLSYDTVFSYVSKGKDATIVQYGWSDNNQTYILDIDFDSFDAKLTQYKDDMNKYWQSQGGCY